MKTLNIKLPDGKVITHDFEGQVCLENLIPETEYPILSALCQNENIRLNSVFDESAEIEFLDLRNNYANMSYQASLTLLYLKAVEDILGKHVQVTIANSLSKGVYTRIHLDGINEETIQKLENYMHEIAEQNLPIEEEVMNRDELLKYVNADGDKDEKKLLESAVDLKKAMVCRIGETHNLFYLHTLPSTGYLKLFELKKYRNGVLLRFPHPRDPLHVAPFEEQKLLYNAFSEENHWQKLIGVKDASQLNEKIVTKECLDLVMLTEALHEKKIADIATAISESKKRIILIAGPSSSGKTTFAKRLCIQLRVIGLKPLYLGTDDYFVNREDMVPDEKGELDFEALSAVDVGLFDQQMNDLLAGRKVDIPEFDFIEGKKVFGKRITSIQPNQPIVIEGIHGLNPQLTKDIPDEEKIRIYISPLTQLNIDTHNRVPTTDARMLRRLVRDYRTRGRDAATTIRDWPSVRKGEDVNIFPFCYQADLFFNSQCIYELAALKKYAKPLLEGIGKDEKEYPEAQRMLRFLDFFAEMKDDACIPLNSIIREFIGGSVIMN
ncbi:MAG: hypothetical protein IKR11_07585 [Solobacterium sp.]|nr:hypothetical protein [Solobacterium sp.]